jgi:glycosyltransferase involved in cell wall biosynthesis
MQSAVAFVLKGYPRLSESFIAQEIRALERRGLAIRIYSLRRPTEAARHPIHAEIKAPITYLPEYLHRAPLRLWRAFRGSRRLPGYRAARAAWLRDLRRDPSANRIRRFGQALVLAHELAPDIRHIHAHFLHTPASVARYSALMRELPFSLSAHAKDIWTSPDWEKREKLADCRFALTCTRQSYDHLSALAPAGRVELVYHGLDLKRFPPLVVERARRDGTDPANPIRILSVGRVIEKKGYDDLLAALARLPAGLHWRFIQIGGGPLEPALATEAARRGLAERIKWRGAQPQGAVLAALREADLFVLAAKRAKNGDQDGLPNVLMEALSQSLAIVATRFAAVPELIEDGVSGLLVPPADPEALGQALARLSRDPLLRERLGSAGRARLQAQFSLDTCIAPLAARFGLAPERAS